MIRHRMFRLSCRRTLHSALFLGMASLASIAQAGMVFNQPPTISGSPPDTVTLGATYVFQPTGHDPEGKTLQYLISGRPAWATFNRTTGRLSGTPPAAGTTAPIVISVNDGAKTALLPAFTIAVVTNRAPTISGQVVASAQVDRPYAFRPVASDPDADALTFSISNKPAWATFDSSSGTLYGTPTAANIGSAAGIVISVNDGKATASLPAFAINVAPAPKQSVVLEWTAPTMNTDGSALTDLSGYKVFYGGRPGEYGTSIRLWGAGTTNVIIEGLASGTYYFTIKSINNAGLESDYAAEVIAHL